MEEVGSSVYTRGREVLDAERDAEETGVGKSTVASVDGECWRVRTNETKSPGFASISAQGTNETRGDDCGVQEKRKEQADGSERTRTSEREERKYEGRYKVMKQAGARYRYMRCSLLVRAEREREQPRHNIERAEAVLVVVVIVALPPLSSLFPLPFPARIHRRIYRVEQ